MRSLPIFTVMNELNEYIDLVASTQDQVIITRSCSPAAVLIGAAEWESILDPLRPRGPR